MARISREQAASIAPSGGSWFKLPNDRDTAIIQFPYRSQEDVDMLSVHKIEDEQNPFGYKVDCKRDFEDSIDTCPLCAAGYSAIPAYVLKFYNHTTQQVEFWDRSRKFLDKIFSLMETYGEDDFDTMCFQVQRLGAPKDMQTTYEFMLLPNEEPIDWEELDAELEGGIPEVVGKAIRDKSYEDMEEFLETGNWPQQDRAGNQQRPQRSARRAAPPARGAARGTERAKAAAPTANARRPRGENTSSRGSRGGSRGGNEQF